MGIEYFIIAVIIAIIYIWQKYTSRIKSGLVFPSTIFMLMWAFACFASVIVQAYDLLDDFGSGYKIVGPYIFLFILVSLLGFLLASKTIRINLDAYNFNSDYISYFLEKMKIFLYLSFLLGLVRIYFMVKIFGWETLYDYRQNALIASSIENNGIFDLVVQISSYIYVLATFSVVLLAIKQALTGFNLKEMLWYFIFLSGFEYRWQNVHFGLYFMFLFHVFTNKGKK